MSMTKAVVVVLTVLSFGYAGVALAAGTGSGSTGSKSSSAQASSAKTSSSGSPAASKAAAKGALNANGPSLDGLDARQVIVSKADRVSLTID